MNLSLEKLFLCVCWNPELISSPFIVEVLAVIHH